MLKENQYFPETVSHPGTTLEEKLEELSMGVKEFALRTDKPEKTIIAILNGGSSITPEMAVQFENVLKIPAHFWLNRQRLHDESKARKKRKEAVHQAMEWAGRFPTKEMMRLNWLPMDRNKEKQTFALLAFFGVSSPKAWQAYYMKSELKVQFRISLAHSKEPYALSAWLRRGEIQAATVEAAPYSEKTFKNALPEIKKVMAKHPADFFARLCTFCSGAGVKVVHTPCLPKAPISGATRWLNDTPLIQLTGRYKRNDSFWFTFFHEAGHILLHGKKDIFLENVEYSDKDKEKEEEANRFAQEWVLKAGEKEKILAHARQTGQLTRQDVIDFARQFHTHPAAIIGQLQHDKLIPYSVGRSFIEPVELE